jgi:hypothetical protein
MLLMMSVNGSTMKDVCNDVWESKPTGIEAGTETLFKQNQ